MKLFLLRALLVVLSVTVYVAQEMLLASKRCADWVHVQLIAIEIGRKP